MVNSILEFDLDMCKATVITLPITLKLSLLLKLQGQACHLKRLPPISMVHTFNIFSHKLLLLPFLQPCGKKESQ